MEVVVTAKGRIMSNVHPGGLSLSIWGGRKPLPMFLGRGNLSQGVWGEETSPSEKYLGKPLPRCLGRGKKLFQGIMRGDGSLSVGVF